jgi:hypothetical protein
MHAKSNILKSTRVKLLRLLPVLLASTLAIYLLLGEPNRDAYSTIAIVAFVILLEGAVRNGALLQPFNLFLVFFFFYNFTSHFLFELSGLAVLGAFHSDENRDHVVHQALIAYCFMVACAPLFSRNVSATRGVIFLRIEAIRARLIPRRLAIISIPAFVLTFAVFAPILPLVIQSGIIDRSQSSQYISPNLWLFLGLICYVGSFLSILAMRRHRLYCAVSLILFGAYFLMDMAVGGRKILFYLVLTLAPWMWACQAFRAKHGIYAAVTLLLPITMRAMIDKVDVVERDLAGIVAGIFGEFLFTSGTGYIIDANYQTICRDVDVTSYFYWLIYLIPRAVYESKPYSLAIEFANYMDMGMGFALTPIAEAYCVGSNFAWFFLLLSTLVLFAAISFASRKSVVVYLIAIALSMDINRGEFSYTVVQMTTIFIIYKFLIRIASRSAPTVAVATPFGSLPTSNSIER